MTCPRCGSKKVMESWGDDNHGHCGSVYTCESCWQIWEDGDEDFITHPTEASPPHLARDATFREQAALEFAKEIVRATWMDGGNEQPSTVIGEAISLADALIARL